MNDPPEPFLFFFFWYLTGCLFGIPTLSSSPFCLGDTLHPIAMSPGFFLLTNPLLPGWPALRKLLGFLQVITPRGVVLQKVAFLASLILDLSFCPLTMWFRNLPPLLSPPPWNSHSFRSHTYHPPPPLTQPRHQSDKRLNNFPPPPSFPLQSHHPDQICTRSLAACFFFFLTWAPQTQHQTVLIFPPFFFSPVFFFVGT